MWLFRDETLHTLEVPLDEAFRIPGTRIRFGLGGIIGLVPGRGDGADLCHPRSVRVVAHRVDLAALTKRLRGIGANQIELQSKEVIGA